MAAAFGEDDGSGSPDVTDDQLVERVAVGDKQAFAMLYERHVDAARAYARVLVGSWQQVDDLVAESFVKIFDRMTVGRGHVSAFRAYLIATVRTTFYKRNAIEKRYSHCDEFDDVASGEQGMSERAVDKLDFELAAKAFAALPERWQQVLWMLEVQQESTEAIGAVLGIKANAVSALAFRARDGLRLAYLQLHISGRRPAECRKPASELAQWLCGRLGRAERARVAEHLDGCGACQDAVAELTDLLNQMRRFVPAVPRPASAADQVSRTPRPRKLTGLGLFALAAGFALLWSAKAVGPVLADIDDSMRYAAPAHGGLSVDAGNAGGAAAPKLESVVVAARSTLRHPASVLTVLARPAAKQAPVALVIAIPEAPQAPVAAPVVPAAAAQPDPVADGAVTDQVPAAAQPSDTATPPPPDLDSTVPGGSTDTGGGTDFDTVNGNGTTTSTAEPSTTAALAAVPATMAAEILAAA